jgi:hypothetical protein
VLLVAEVNACFEQLTHGKVGQCHEMAPLPVLAAAKEVDGNLRHRMGIWVIPDGRASRVNYAGIPGAPRI